MTSTRAKCASISISCSSISQISVKIFVLDAVEVVTTSLPDVLVVLALVDVEVDALKKHHGALLPSLAGHQRHPLAVQDSSVEASSPQSTFSESLQVQSTQVVSTVDEPPLFSPSPLPW